MSQAACPALAPVEAFELVRIVAGSFNPPLYVTENKLQLVAAIVARQFGAVKAVRENGKTFATFYQPEKIK